MRFRIAFLAALAAATLTARRLPVQVYTTAQGLPRNQVDCMVFSPTGMLWVCTSEGLARFDGYHFRLFGPEDGLPSQRILDMVPSRRGGYWLISSAGVCRLTPQAKTGQPCRLLDVDKKTADWFGDAVLETPEGDTWVSNGVALFHISSDGRRLESTSFEVNRPELVTMVAQGLEGDLLVGTDQALYSWKPGAKQRSLSRAIGPIGPLQALQQPSGEMLLGATNGLFRLTHRDGAYSLSKLQHPGIAYARVVLRRRDGSVWIGGNGGVRHIEVDSNGRLDVLEQYTDSDGLPSPEVVWLTEDSQGNLWGITEGAGIFRIAAGGFVTYFANDGLGVDRIAAIFEDEAHRVVVEPSWASDPSFRVWDAGRFRAVPLAHPAHQKYFGWGSRQLSLRSQGGEWWVPTGEGVLRYPKLARLEDISHTMPRLYAADSPAGCNDVFRAFEDAAGDIWLTCIQPRPMLIRWQRSKDAFRNIGAADGWLEGAVPIAMRQAPNGTVWMVSGSSAFRFRNEKFDRFSLKVNERLPNVRDLLVDHAGRVWVATDFEGLLRCDNPEEPRPVFRQYTTREGLSTNSVQTVQEDGSGFLYAGTAVGVDRIDPQAPVDSRRVRHFTAADGLPDTLLTTSFRDSRGNLWFGSLHGLAVIDPARLPRHSPPPVYVMRLRVRGEDIPLPWNGAQSVSLDLASDRNQVEIEYAGIDLGSARSLHYQYRLGSVDRDWGAPVDQLSVNYASLPSGPFRFEVRAVDAEGQLSPQAAAIELTVAAPLWRRWWALLSASLVLSTLIAIIYDYRVRNLLAVERLRTRIATDLHDDIGASLTQISILSELARRNYAPSVLADIAQIARALAQDMSDIVWAVNPRHDRFEGLVHRMRRFANDTLGGAEIDVNFEVQDLPPDFTVPLDARRPLYLVFKEAVNNVARHAGATKAFIRLSLDGAAMKLEVKDDGRGFNTDDPIAGEGLASLARRMRDLGGQASWDSRPGGGTRFTAVLPLRTRVPLPELLGSFRKAGR